MLNLGLTLTLQDFKNIVIQPRPLIIGLIGQMIILPLIAFSIASVSWLTDELKVGIILIAACPGGATSNLITYLLKGDVPLSVSLTAVNSALILITIPLITYLALHAFMEQSELIELPVFTTIIKIFYMIIIPTAIGITVRAYFKKFAKNTARYMKFITTALLAVVYLFVILEKNNGDTISTIADYMVVAPYVLVLNILGMLTGYFTGRLFGYGKPRQITFSVEIGIQNSALAITIASSEVFLGNHQMAIPALVYGLFTFFNAVLFGLIIKKIFKDRPTKYVT